MREFGKELLSFIFVSVYFCVHVCQITIQIDTHVENPTSQFPLFLGPPEFKKERGRGNRETKIMLLEVAKSIDVKENTPFVVQINDTRLCIIRSDGLLYCIEDHCPHQQLSLKDASVDGSHLMCQYHGVEIDLEGCTITNTMGFTNLSSVEKHPVLEKSGFIYIDLSR